MKKSQLIKNTFQPFFLAVIAASIITLAGCNDDEDKGPSQKIIEIISDTEGLDSLAKYLELFPQVASVLETEGDYTFFAPTNTAFISLLSNPGFPPDITSVNPSIIANVLAYHVSSTRYNSSDLTAGTEIMTLAVAQDGVDEIITVNQDGTLFTGSTTTNIQVVTPDIEATNGVIHTTSNVLIPLALDGLAEILPTTYGTIILGANFSILADAIEEADKFAFANQKDPLASILTGSNTHTVFAPTNATFEGGSITVDTYSGQQWYGIIANHVVLSEVSAATLTSAEAESPGLEYTSAAGFGLYMFYAADNAANGIGIFIDSDGDQTPNAEVALPNTALPDLLTKPNGIIHIIAGVMAPPAQ